MSYFFPVTADIVSGKIRTAPPGDSGDSGDTQPRAAAARTSANTNCRHVATVASPPASQISDTGKKEGAAPDPTWWRELFEERAAVREYDGGLSRADAEAGALADLAAHWRALNPLPASTDAACVHCGKPGPDTPVLAPGGHAWLHRACWAPMDRVRDAQARAAVLAALAGLSEETRDD